MGDMGEGALHRGDEVTTVTQGNQDELAYRPSVVM
jgi:hypothetical protein